MNVVLDKKNGLTEKLLYELVNQQDRKGNTPLHYAIKSWPPTIMKRLLELGADIGLENHNKEDSMSKISPKVLQNYLDTTCVELDDSHLKCEDFIKYKGFNECKNVGRLRLEGKDYLVSDGDVMYFRVGN